MPTRRQPASWLVHLYRWGIFVLILLLIHDQHRWQRSRRLSGGEPPIPLAAVQSLLPGASDLSEPDPIHGGRYVHDAEGNVPGCVLQTSPRCDSIVGFSGPTNTLIALDPSHRIAGIGVLESEDTTEHVEMVISDAEFLEAFEGLTWNEARHPTGIDAVSGATLTSLAIVESVATRLGGSRPSLRFPEAVQIQEARAFFPEAVRLEPLEHDADLLRVLDAEGRELGRLARTSPGSDDLMGYQGPTDTLLALDPDGETLRGVSIRSSYDNEPYVGDVKSNPRFQAWFRGRTTRELAAVDLREAGMEGVSGATMTSLTVAEAVARACRDLEERASRPSGRSPGGGLRVDVLGTTLVIVAALAIAFTRLRRRRALRVVLLLVLIGYLGLLQGDLLSQALLVGWARNGIPWMRALSLVLLAAAAFLVPLLTPRQTYCHHLCAHGAAQELLKGRLQRRFHLPRRVERLARTVPWLLLLLVLVVTLLHLPLPLAAIEPFDGYILRAGSVAALVIAAVGLVASLFVPMAYCRYGCPTGALLGFLRRRPHVRRFARADLAALGFLLAALALMAAVRLIEH